MKCVYEEDIIDNFLDIDELFKTEEAYDGVLICFSSLKGIRIKGDIEKCVMCDGAFLRGMLDENGLERPFDLDKCRTITWENRTARMVPRVYFKECKVIGSQENICFNGTDLIGALDGLGNEMVWEINEWAKYPFNIDVYMSECKVKGDFSGHYLKGSIDKSVINENNEPVLIDFDNPLTKLHSAGLYGTRIRGTVTCDLNHHTAIENCLDEFGDRYTFDFDKMRAIPLEVWKHQTGLENKDALDALALTNVNIIGSYKGLDFSKVHMTNCTDADGNPFVLKLDEINNFDTYNQFRGIKVSGVRPTNKLNNFTLENCINEKGEERKYKTVSQERNR